MSGTRRAQPTPGANTAIASSPWIVVSVGVVVMVVLLFVALGTYRSRGPVGEAFPAPEWTMSLPTLPPTVSRSVTEPPAPVVPGLSPRSTLSPSGAQPAGHVVVPTPAGEGGAASLPAEPAAPPPAGPPAPAPEPPPTPAKPPASPSVTGAYRVMNAYDGAFIGEVLVRNESRSQQDWTVRMTFPYAHLVTAWIEGAPQGRISRSGDTWTFTSGVDLAPGASVPLRFHFDQTRSTRPTTCTVDGAGCSGLR
ncbi:MULTISPECIES: cellulose binding domain-containing protein [unclassified Micromonospora]|uniref:cellulose binding domain-containing protein n=1 Tax=unclassified Micromonospora TaxID=2617518 RepID=UPI003626E3AA